MVPVDHDHEKTRSPEAGTRYQGYTPWYRGTASLAGTTVPVPIRGYRYQTVGTTGTTVPVPPVPTALWIMVMTDRSMPGWLRRHLEDSGVMAPGGITRRARATWCRRCGGPIMSGLDDDRCAVVAHVDPAPLDARGELLALLAGHATFDLAWRGVRYEIDRRSDFEIRGWPPRSRPNVDVVREHVCGDAPESVTASMIERRAAAVLPEECPF